MRIFSLFPRYLMPLPVLFILFAGTISGQVNHRQALIRVTDQKSSEPVAFAHICFEGLSSGRAVYSLTSVDGTAANNVNEPSKIVVSYVGYGTYTDTIRPGQTLDVRLTVKALTMDEVVVTAQYTPEKVDKSIYKVDVITSRQIEQKAATNMAELLKDQSGMRVSQDGVLGTSLRIQGLSGENVKFLMDGVPMIGRMNGNFDLNQINLYNVDHVELIEGPMSVIYGSNALAGVINIITRENKISRFQVNANGYYESVGVANFDGTVAFNKNRNGFSAGGGRNFFGGYSPEDTSRSQPFKPRRQYFADLYYTYTSETMKIKLAGDYFNELLLDKGPLEAPYYETAFDNDFTTQRFSGRAEFSLKMPANRFLNAMVSYSYYQRDRQTFYKDMTTLNRNPVQESWAQDTTILGAWVARGTYAKSNPDQRFNYQAGFDVTYETGEGGKILDDRQELGDFAGFLSVKYSIFKPRKDGRDILSIQPGIRAIYNTRYKAPLVYAISLKYGATPNLNLRFSWSKGFRAPSIKELYLNFVDVNHDVKGNPDLQAERSDNLNLNVNYVREKKKIALSSDLTLFFNRITNVILLAPTGKGLEYTYVNLSKYRTAGFRFDIDFSIIPALKIQTGFTETGVSGSSDPDSVFAPMKWSSEFSVSAVYRFVKPEITLSLFFKYTGKTPQLSYEEEQLVWGWVDSYPMMDFTAGKGFWGNRIRLSIGVRNLFNTVTIPATGSGGSAHSSGGTMNISWGRTVFAKIAFQLNRYK